MTSSTKDQLAIYRDDLLAGYLRRTQSGCEFKFTPEFLADFRYRELASCIPKTALAYTSHGVNLPPFFAGLLPEGLRLKSLVKKLKTSEDDLFAIFAAAGAHVVGDVYAMADAGSPARAKTPKLREIDFYEEFEKVVSESLYQNEDALAGVQEKISASMISFPLNIAKAEKSYILKLNPKDKPHLVENELACMWLAERCRIDTAKVKLVRDKNANHGLLVERFDRVWNESTKKLRPLHQEDGCQILDRYPADKYRIQLSEIAEGAQKVVTAPAPTLLKLLRLYAFSYAIGNGDLHAKNISFFTSSAFNDLTPAYDLISTYIYGDQKMAMKLDGKDDAMTGKMCVHFGERYGVASKATRKMLDRLDTDLQKHASKWLKMFVEDEKKITALERNLRKRLADLKK